MLTAAGVQPDFVELEGFFNAKVMLKTLGPLLKT